MFTLLNRYFSFMYCYFTIYTNWARSQFIIDALFFSCVLMTEVIKCSSYVCPFNLSGTAQWVWSMWTLMLTPVMWFWGRRLDMGPRSDAAWRRVFWTVREWSRLACVVRDTLLMHMSGAGRRYLDRNTGGYCHNMGQWEGHFDPVFSRQGQRISGEKCKELKMS